MKRLLAILLIFVMLLGLLPATVFAANITIKINVPTGVSVSLYTSFAGNGSSVSGSSSTSGSTKTVTYSGISGGTYSFYTRGTGYYEYYKNIYLTSGSVTYNGDPGKKSNKGFENGRLVEYTDGCMSNSMLSKADAWAGYEDIFDTPFFTISSKAKNEFTTQDEMMAYINERDDDDDNMYVYTIGKSPTYNFDIPMAIFTTTDISGKSVEKAAELVRANGKPTVLYQGQIHGNEPAGGEGSLALLGALDRGKLKNSAGKDILESINVLVIPRINVDGSKDFTRVNSKNQINMNRDYLALKTSETTDVITMYNLFLPEVVVDAHEMGPDNAIESTQTYEDFQIWAGMTNNNASSIWNTDIDMMEYSFDFGKSKGLRSFFYLGIMNYGEGSTGGGNNSIGPTYYSLRGSLAFCVETLGINIGRAQMHRRVYSHFVSAEAILKYTANNSSTVKSVVQTERNRIINAGKTYSSSNNKLILGHSGRTYGTSYVTPLVNMSTGKIADSSYGYKPTIYDQTTKSRARPVAYLLKSSASGLSKVLAHMDKHDIKYYKMGTSGSISVKQYSGSGSSASLGSATSVSFPAGSVIIPMNQMNGNIIGMLMEPDVTDTNSSSYYSTYVQTGTLSASSIYRYEGSLSSIEKYMLPEGPSGLSVVQPTATVATGSIIGFDPAKSYEYRLSTTSSYTAVPAGTTELTGLKPGVYYVRYPASGTTSASAEKEFVIYDASSPMVFVNGSSGNDNNNGLTEATAVKTLSTAYTKLDGVMKAIGGSEGTIMITGDVTISSDIDFPNTSYTTVIKGKTTSVGIKASANFGFNGKTRLENLKIQKTSGASGYNNICANGNYLTIGENVNCVADPNTTSSDVNRWFSLTGGKDGRYNVENTISANPTLNVASGQWYNIYYCGYAAGVSGTTTINVTGGTIDSLRASYYGACSGTVNVSVKNATITGMTFGGNVNKNNFSGNINITLGSGTVTNGKVYAGTRDAGNVTGTVTITVDGASIKGGIDGKSANSGTVGKSVVVLKKGTMSSAITNAGTIKIDTSKGGTLTLSTMPSSVNSVVGGGTVKFAAGKTLAVASSVSGITKITLTGTISNNQVCVTAPTSVSADAFTLVSDTKAFGTKDSGSTRSWYILDHVHSYENGACSVCGAVCAHKFPNDYSSVEKEPTCTTNGSATKLCSVCGMATTISIPATGHSFPDDYTIIDKEATCTEEGIASRECAACGEKESKTIPATGHSFPDDYTIIDKAATCTEPGIATRECAACGEKESTTIPATGHSFPNDYPIIDKAATCTEEGIASRECAACGEKESKTIPATGHKFPDGFTTVEKEATCTADGSATRVCSACGLTETVTIPATGHSFPSGYTAVVRAATCTVPGSATKVCSGCGEIQKVTIPAIGHTMSGNVCTACGYVSSSGKLIHFIAGTPSASYSWNAFGSSSVTTTTTSYGYIKSKVALGTNGSDHYMTSVDEAGYKLQSGDIIEIRFKSTKAQSSAAPFLFWYTKSTGATEFSSSTCTKLSKSITFAADTWTTVQLTPTAGQTVYRMLIDAYDSDSSFDGATLYVDYIYMGPANGAPSKVSSPAPLYFGFTNDLSAQARYSTKAYGYFQTFDSDLDHWFVNTGRATKAVSNGNLVLKPLENGSPYVQSANASGSTAYADFPLNYTLKGTEYVQISVKFENCVLMDKNANAEIYFNYFTSGTIADEGHTSGAPYDYGTKMVVDKAYLNDGQYHVFTIPMHSEKTVGEVLSAFRMGFNNVNSANSASGNGSIAIDYVAVGTADKLPLMPVYTVTFQNEDGTVLATQSVAKGEAAIYIGTPGKAADESGHYSFRGWDKSFLSVAADMVVTAQYTVEAHTFSYTQKDAESHTATCACGWTAILPHTVTEGEIIIAPTCTETGTMTSACADCGASTTTTVDALGHELGDWEVITAPTCTEDGTSERHCSRCDYFETEITKADGHTYDEGVVTLAPTCAAEGVMTYTCPCGDSYTEAIPATEHANLSTTTVDATCTENGSITVTCGDCGTVVSSEEIVAIGHIYNAVVTQPTCTEGGYTTYTCACGDSYTADETEALGHSYESSVTLAATCTKDGVMTFTCACGDSYTEAIPATGHVELTTSTLEATCTEDGAVTVTCSCGEYTTTEVIPALGHNEVIDSAAEPDCLNTGLTEGKHCDRCGEVLTAQEEIPALGHNEVIDNAAEPDCLNAGKTEGKHCDRCGEVLIAQDVIPALGHSYEAVVTAPTCTEDGYTTYTCACGESYVADETEALGHSYEKDVVEPTCVATGSVTYTCACGDSYVETLDALGHTEAVVEGYAATCTEDGLSNGVVCSVCGEILTAQEVIPALGHDLSFHEAIPATCTENGNVAYCECLTCGKLFVTEGEEMFEVPMSYIIEEALGHTETVAEAVAPSCTETGLTEGKYCAVCGEILIAQEEIPALGHNEAINAAKAPTCTETGLTEGKYCDRCGEILIAQEKISALGHSYEADVTAPTCTEGGYTTYTCFCGDSYTADETEALGHSYESTSVVAPTCELSGEETFTCAVCGDSYTETIEALGHEEVADTGYAATCTETGLTDGKHCGRCNVVLLAQEEIPALGHDLVFHKAKHVTCTEDGHVPYYQCNHCAKYFADAETVFELPESYITLKALGHSFEYINEGNVHRIVCRNRCDATDEHGTSCSNGCDYDVTEAHSFTDGLCVCGAVEITEPTEDSSLTFGAQLYLENDLTMAFRVKQDKLTAYDISTAYLVVERDIYETGAAQATVETTTIDEYKIENSRLIFSYPGIAAAQMNDAIRATLHIKTSDGKEYVSPVLNTSVATYLDGLLSGSASDTKMVTLIMDMLNYGAAAQVYFDRHADAPVNVAFESFKTYASYASADFTKVLENLATSEGTDGKAGKLNLGLDLGTRIGIQYKVTVPADVNVEDVTLVVTDANGNVLETLTVAGNPTDNKGRYIVNFYGFTSRDLRRVVYATAYAGGEAITGTYAYSISTYA